MAAFDRNEFMQNGRADNAASIAALELMAKRPATPYREAGVNWAFLVQRNEDNIQRLEATLELRREYLAKLKEKTNGT